MPAEVRIDASRLERLLRGPGSPGVRLLRRRAGRVADRARVLGSRHGSMGDYVQDPVITGSGRGLTAVIVCTHHATKWVIEGTPGHFIVARRAKYLRFEVEGQVLYRKRVWHPGYDGDNFMMQALRDVL